MNALCKRIRYGGNPEHKRNQGDFGLAPLSARPRADKTRCDPTGILTKSVALSLLRAGARKGLISRQQRGHFPQNIWSVKDGIVLEAQLENQATGAYHGYPLPKDDDLGDILLEEWKKR
jgi:hypothetical protein